MILIFFLPNRTLKKKKKTGPVDRSNANVRPAKNKNVKITRRFWLLQWLATATVIGFSVDAWWTAPIEWVLWKRNLALAVFKKQTSRRDEGTNSLLLVPRKPPWMEKVSCVWKKRHRYFGYLREWEGIEERNKDCFAALISLASWRG